MALTHSTNKEVVVAVVVVIADSDAHPEHWDRKPDLAGHVGERAIVIVVIKLRRGRRTGMSGPVFAVDDQDVGPAVVIVVNEGAARPHGLGQILLSKRAIVVSEMDASLRGD